MNKPLPRGYDLVGKIVVNAKATTAMKGVAQVVTGWHGGDLYMVVPKWYLDKYPDKTAGGIIEHKHLALKGGNPDCECWETNHWTVCCGEEE